MPITANSLFRDSLNFMRNQLSSFIMLALLTSFISYVLLQALSPDMAELNRLITGTTNASQISRSELHNMINEMNNAQQQAIISAALPLFGAISLSFLLSNMLLIASTITLVIQVSQGQPSSALRAIGASAGALPMLFVLLVIAATTIIFGLSLYFLPGLFFMFVLAMSPIILLVSKRGLFYAVGASWTLAFANTKLILPILLVTLSTKFILLLLSVNLATLSPIGVSLLMGAMSNLVTAFLFVYLFRLYTLKR